MTALIIPRRFCGPDSSGNGGWTAGALVEATADAWRTDPDTPGWPAIQVMLRRPPPLDTELAVVSTGAADVELRDDRAEEAVTVATAQLAATPPAPVAPVSADEAAAAEAAYPGLTRHPFARCFVCGTERDPGDGLGLRPGPVTEGDGHRLACCWTPHDSLADGSGDVEGDGRPARLAAAWAALDCPGGWAGDLTERMMVLGSMTTHIHRLPALGERHVVVGERRGVDGRKTFTATSLYDESGTLLGTAEHVWIAIDPGQFR